MDARLFIDGELVDGTSPLEVINPATGKVFTSVPRASQAQAEQAVAAAKRALPGWAALSYVERRGYLMKFADAMEARKDEFTRLLTREQGKPLAEAEVEVTFTIAALRYFAWQALETKVFQQTASERVLETRYPQGVVVAINPWNFPLILLMHKLGAALITGNPVIAKPASTTPLTTLLLGEVSAGILPPGVFQTITAQREVTSLLTSHPDVAHISFTGSTPTGKQVLHSLADTVKRFSLELGGNDPCIVLDDADIGLAARKAYAGAMLNCGQVCFAAKRIFVPRPMMDDMCDALAEIAAAAVVGDGSEAGVTQGPLQNKDQYEKVKGYIEEARALGTVITPDRKLSGEGYFIAPTIIRDLPDSAGLVREEQFGPAMPVLAYDTVDEVIARANGTEFGLGGSVFSSDVARAIAVAERIESGMVWVNQAPVFPFHIPYGGAKESGIGRQAGIVGMEEFTQVRMINATFVD